MRSRLPMNGCMELVSPVHSNSKNGPAPTALSRVGQLASLPRVHAAFRWLHLHERKVMQWQRELVAIAAPPFGERARAEWLAARFQELGLEKVAIDEEGNVLGLGPGKGPDAASHRCVMLAHIDTVFPSGTPIEPVVRQPPPACARRMR